MTGTYGTWKAIAICVAILFVAFAIDVRADGSSFSANIELDYDLEQILNFREANFSTCNETVNYRSTILNDPKGMTPLYNISNRILNLFVYDDPILDGYIEINENFNFTLGRKFHEHQWFDVVKHYWPILLVVLFSGLIAFLMPIVG